MGDQLSAQDWVNQGLKTLAKRGFTALKAEPLAKAMGVSRGSFYWHFADIGAYHAAILKHWHEIAAEQIIAGLEAAAEDGNPLSLLVRGAFSTKPTLEVAVRNWAAIDPKARAAVLAIDRRRIDYIEQMLRRAGLKPDIASSRAQILYWVYLGYALSDQPLSSAKQQAVIDELLRMVVR